MGGRMSDIQWFPAVLGLLGGGAVGAMITAFVTTHRGRIQPVRYHLELKELFAGVAPGPSTSVQVMLSDRGAVYAFSDLQQVSLEITNGGNVDRANFKFSLSFPEGTKIVFVEANDADRNHKFITKPEISPGKPVDVLDFEIEPFNRRDIYQVAAYVTEASELNTQDIKLTSPAPVLFVYTPSTAEMLAARKDVTLELFAASLPIKALRAPVLKAIRQR